MFYSLVRCVIIGCSKDFSWDYLNEMNVWFWYRMRRSCLALRLSLLWFKGQFCGFMVLAFIHMNFTNANCAFV